MNHSLLSRTAFALLSSGLLFFGPASVYAQQDEPNFEQLWKKHSSVPFSSVMAKAPAHRVRQTTTLTAHRNGPCDLLLNGNFETQAFTTGPSRVNNLGGGRPWDSGASTPMASDLPDWSSPTGGTPDYFANNATIATMVPATAVYGGFTPMDNGSVGLGMIQEFYDPNIGRYYDRVSEYVSTTNLNLVPGRYYATFLVKLSRNSEAATRGINNGFGLQMSNGQLPDANNSTRDFLAPSGRGLLSSTPLNDSNIDQWVRTAGQMDVNSGDNTMTVGLFNSDPGNMPQLTGRRTDLARSYVFVDNIELFRIPTAGPNHPCSGSGPAGPVHLGEGCSIPGATYAWRKVGDPTVIASTIETDVTPPATTTYELTVTLPDGSTYRTTTQVDVCVYSVALNVTNNRANNCGPRVLTAAVVYGSGNYSYFWNSNPAASGNIGNTSSITVNPSVVTTYTVLVYDNVTGRAVQSSVVVGPEINGTPSVFVPNIFTPNGDGVNDTWQVRDASRGFGPIHAYGYRLQVFDRWGGQKLDRSFTDTQFNSLGLMGGQIQWDGRDANGQGCVDGDYYYYVTLYNCSQAYTDYLKGWVTINGSRYRAAAPDIHPPVEVASRLAVYPNPANERLLIDPAVLSEAAKASGATVGSPRYQVELRDKTGQLRYSGTAADQQLEVDTKALPAGLYFLRLTGPKGEVVTKQIVVDHTR